MASVGEYFSIGSLVSCKTCFDQMVEGEVLAFDPQSKMLILIKIPECASKSPDKLSDVYIINIGFCSDVHVKNEVSTITEAPQSLNISRLRTRYRNSVEQRQRWLSALAAGVSPEGQNLYMAVSKQLNDVTWSGQNIVVFNEVTISPPYTVDNITAENGKASSLTYVKKVVEQFFNMQAAAAATANNQGAASNSKGSSVGSSNSSVSPVPAN